jgi:AraC-like DNA-binding protein
VHFHALIWGSLDLLSMLGFPRVVPRTTQTDWEGFSRRLARERALGLAGWQRAMSNAIYDVLLLVIRSHGASFVPPGGAMIAKALPRLLPVFSLIDERIADCQLSIRDCARAIEVSEVYLRGLFRSLTGVPPLEFLQRRRIERACDILRSSDESIKSIAWSVGFTDVPYFYRVFKKWMRTTPASYRARPIR